MNMIKNEDAKAFATLLLSAAHQAQSNDKLEFDLDAVAEAKYGEEKAKVLSMFGPAPAPAPVKKDGEKTDEELTG